MLEFDVDMLELLLAYVALPVIIGLFSLFIVTFYDSRTSRRARDKERRANEIEGARKVMDNVMQDAERLSSLMRYHAWAIAWRKRRPEGIFEEDLIEADEQKWRLYDEALTDWRSRRIQYKRAVDIYFGKRDDASRLLTLIDATIDKLSFELWFIYHNNPANPNVFLQSFVEDIGDSYDTVFNAIMTSVDKKITRAQEETVHKAAANAFDELQDKVSRLCFEMSESIRNENVGILRSMTINSLARTSKVRSQPDDIKESPKSATTTDAS
jgi:hypothetical protein